MTPRQQAIAAGLVGLVSAGYAIAIAFGLHVTQDQRNAVIGAIPAIVIVVGLVLARRVAEVHELVNSKSDAQEQRIVQLEKKLVAADVQIPAHPEKPAGADA